MLFFGYLKNKPNLLRSIYDTCNTGNRLRGFGSGARY